MNVKKQGAIACAVAIAATMLQTSNVFAAEVFSTGDSFTQLFHTRGFMGNAEILTKLNFVAALVSDVISVCGFIGVSLTVIRLMISLLYKSNPVLFDEIDEIKQSNTWSGGEGVKGMAGGTVKFLLGGSLNGIKNKSGGGIIDTIIWFVLGAMPNVKHYSDSADGGDEKLKDLSTTQYLLKISPKIIMQIFFFSIAWNGVLFQAYGSVVDAMGVAAQRAVNDDLAIAVENALDTGKTYAFTFENDGTAFGAFKQSVAEDMYNEARKKMSKSTRTQENYYDVGVAIENLVKTLDENDVVTVGSALANTINVNQSAEEQLKNSNTWTGCDTGLPEGATQESTVICQMTDGSKTYDVYRVVKDKELVGYAAAGGGSPKYIAKSKVATTGTVQVNSGVYDNVHIDSYTTSSADGAENGVWKAENGRIRMCYCISDVGAGSNVAWVITSQSTPNVYLVCNLYYQETSTGANYLQKVSSSETTGKKEETKQAGEINDGITQK